MWELYAPESPFWPTSTLVAPWLTQLAEPGSIQPRC